MTGGRPGRDPRIAGRRERGPHRGESPPEEPRWTGTGGAELEELHAAEVAVHGGARIGFRAAIAGVALVGLLAVGFGAFGGRPQPSAMPVWTPLAVASNDRAPTPGISEPETPRVTPFTQCAVERNVVPTVTLEVGGVAYPGAIDVLASNPDALPPDAPTAAPPAIVSVGATDPTAIVIRGDRCALAWVLDFDDGTTIDVIVNNAMDPTRFAQNRFDLALADNPGRESLLRAQLLFPGFLILASWEVHVAKTEHPAAELRWLDGEVQPAIESCHMVVQQQETGWEETDGDCAEGASPRNAKPVHEHGLFRFFIGEWPFTLGGIACGHGMDDDYVPAEPGCAWMRNEADGVITVDFPASLAKGTWTLALDACAYDGPIYGVAICGTWYAAVKVR